MAHFADRKVRLRKKGKEKKGMRKEKGMCVCEGQKESYECRWAKREGRGEGDGHNKLFNINRNRKSTNRKTFIDFGYSSIPSH